MTKAPHGISKHHRQTTIHASNDPCRHGPSDRLNSKGGHWETGRQTAKRDDSRNPIIAASSHQLQPPKQTTATPVKSKKKREREREGEGERKSDICMYRASDSDVLYFHTKTTTFLFVLWIYGTKPNTVSTKEYQEYVTKISRERIIN